MGLTVRDVLVNALENLGKIGFKKFRGKLLDFKVDVGYKKIPRGQLEDKDWHDVADIIRKYYKDVYGIEVTLAVLDAINEKKLAEELEKDLKEVDRFVRLNQLEGAESVAPTERPVKLTLCDTGEMMYSLTLEKCYPGYIQIEWTCGKDSPDILSSQEVYTENSDQTLITVCSNAIISQTLLKQLDSTVCVSWGHEYTKSHGQHELSIRRPDFPWTPVVEEIGTPRLFHNIPVTLQCKISGYFPDALTVKWLRRNKQDQELCEESDAVSIPKIRSNKNTDNTFSCIARLTITPTLRNHQGAEYICRVEHPSLENAIKKSTWRFHILVNVMYSNYHVKCPPIPVGKPQMEPIKMALVDNILVQFSLNLKMFYPKDIKLKWHRGETQPRKGVRQGTKHTETFAEHDGYSFDVTSECCILGCGFADPQYKLFVTWEHESMDGPETKSLSVRDLPWSPRVEEIIVLHLEDKQESTLWCNIFGYFPDVVTVSWFKKVKGNVSSVLDSENISKILPKKKKNGTFSCTAQLYFTPTASEDQGSEFICRVEHPSMEKPIERTTGPLQICGSTL